MKLAFLETKQEGIEVGHLELALEVIEIVLGLLEVAAEHQALEEHDFFVVFL